MNESFTDNQFNLILQDKKMAYPLNLAMALAWIIGNLKGVNLQILDLGSKNSLANYFIVASATNTTQAQAISDTIQEQMKKHAFPCQSREGYEEAQWILLDYKDIIIHIFQEYVRGMYELETVWQNARPVKIPYDYYFSSIEDQIPVPTVKQINNRR